MSVCGLPSRIHITCHELRDIYIYIYIYDLKLKPIHQIRRHEDVFITLSQAASEGNKTKGMTYTCRRYRKLVLEPPIQEYVLRCSKTCSSLSTTTTRRRLVFNVLLYIGRICFMYFGNSLVFIEYYTRLVARSAEQI